MRYGRLAVLATALLVGARSAHAVDVTTCGQVVPAHGRSGGPFNDDLSWCVCTDDPTSYCP